MRLRFPPSMQLELRHVRNPRGDSFVDFVDDACNLWISPPQHQTIECASVRGNVLFTHTSLRNEIDRYGNENVTNNSSLLQLHILAILMPAGEKMIENYIFKPIVL